MDAGGGSKTRLPDDLHARVDTYWGIGDPSAALHNGHRWWVTLRFVGDANGDGWCDPGDECYPNGKIRREVFALRGDGQAEVQLTDQADLEMQLPVQWLADPATGQADGSISWLGRRWDMVAETVLEGGVYVGQVAFDTSGNVTGLASQPVGPSVEFGLTTEGMQGGDDFYPDPAPDVLWHDWSPAGTSLVFQKLTASGIWILDDVTQPPSTSRGITTDGSHPEWSTDGTRVAFSTWTSKAAKLETIRTDGSGRTTVVKYGGSKTVGLPCWSPTPGHLVYLLNQGRDEAGCPYPMLCRYDIYRVADTGGTATNLTADVLYNARPHGWR